jgi:endonuclease/exonuclease/phosphatase family metal-dependent hydrolase
MKIIFLNVWEGKLSEPLDMFIEEHIEGTDLFCFQEATPEFQERVVNQYFFKHQVFSKTKIIQEGETVSQIVCASPGVQVQEWGTVLEEGSNTGLGLYVKVLDGSQEILCINFHGYWLPADKNDTPERLAASEKLIAFAALHDGPKIIGGDFNLNNNVESVRMFEHHGYTNLIDTYKIETTRNTHAWRYPVKQLFADFVFTSPEVNMVHFEVPKNEISDHLPLILTVK